MRALWGRLAFSIVGTGGLQRIVPNGWFLDGAAARNPFGSASVTGAGQTITPDIGTSTYFRITTTTNNAYTLAAPTQNGAAITAANALGIALRGVTLTIEFRNTSGGAAGAITPNAIYKLAGGAITQAATANNRKYLLYWDGTNWTEITRGAADIPN